MINDDTPKPSLVTSADRIFAHHALQLSRVGWAVLPAIGKKPAVSGFDKWQWAPRQKTISMWAEKFPDANVAIIPGLSRTEDDCEVVVLDADDLEAAALVEQIFGATPGRVRTRKGFHMYYKLPGGTVLGKIHSLRHVELNIDVKHGQRQAGIVIVPPSRHPDDLTFQYSWDGCDESVIRDLPTLNVSRLWIILEPRGASWRIPGIPNVTIPPAPAPARTVKMMRDGSRGQWLNDKLCAVAPNFSTREQVLDRAAEINASLPDPLDDDEVMKRADAVWKDVQSGDLVPMTDGRASFLMNGAEIDSLMVFKNGTDALALLTKLRAEHSARVFRGETFAVSANAMVRARTMGNWAGPRYRAARDTLLRAGLLEQVRPAHGRTAAQYTLASRAKKM